MGSLGWPQTQDPLASVSQELRLETSSMPCLDLDPYFEIDSSGFDVNGC